MIQACSLKIIYNLVSVQLLSVPFVNVIPTLSVLLKVSDFILVACGKTVYPRQAFLILPTFLTDTIAQ